MAKRQIETPALMELLGASCLWGFGFIATSWALREMGPLALTGVRMSAAFGVGMIVILAVPSLRKQLAWDQFKLAFWPGLFLGLTMILQTWGLKYTTVTKSGFITTLYVLIVPVMESFFLKRKIPKYHMIYVFIALIGVAFICNLAASESGINFGDWITLGCAFAAALQIVWFGKLSNRITSSFNFNVLQIFWCGILPFLAMFIWEPPPTSLSFWPALGMVELVIGSSLIAFGLQVRAQKKLSPSVSSLVFLLESPFAALFSFLLLHEAVERHTLIGAAIILVSLVASVVFSHEGTTTATESVQ